MNDPSSPGSINHRFPNSSLSRCRTDRGNRYRQRHDDRSNVNITSELVGKIENAGPSSFSPLFRVGQLTRGTREGSWEGSIDR